MLDDLFYWLGTAYRDELYIGGLRIGGILCSYADIFVTAILLRVMDVILERKPSKFLYGVLIVFAILTPALLFPEGGLVFAVVQFIVLAPPYLILMYVTFTMAKYFMPYVKRKISGS
ncbi:MAG: hypothetical protein FWG09_08090 [Synergistaceae bacterium]|nr:hypothetical protein [Synergistaceae bacterium]